MSLILTVNSGLGSSLGVFKDGEPLFCIEEERLTRTKNWMGFPYKSVEYVIDNKIVNPKDVTHVGICNSIYRELNRTAFYSNYEKHFKKACTSSLNISGIKNSLRRNIKASDFLFGVYKKSRIHLSSRHEKDIQFLTNMGFNQASIERIPHHYCHAAAAYYGLAENLTDEYLVFTLDGGGDRYTSTIWKAQKGELQFLTGSSCYSIGNMYSATTHFLGFTPHEHEYKLMGLAPYVTDKYRDKYKKYFRQFLELKDENTKFTNPKLLYHEAFMRNLLRDLKKDRFDNIAAGLQAFTEDIVTAWIKGGINKYGIHKVLCGGGVFMNVKLNMLLAKLPEVETINVFPSCGDESNIFGAGFHLYNHYEKKKVKALSSYCLGSTPSADLSQTIDKYKDYIYCEKINKDVNSFIAEQLAENKIVARCSGPMEFGARALGNRSILANPNNLTTVSKINRAIKNRDFWMPFAPAMLWDKTEKLINVPSSLEAGGSPYMMFAFESKENVRDDIICSIHQADFTARAETVTKEHYPDFYEIISCFYAKTGIPCVLNTSFNLHGFPIVENSEQAVDVLLKSKLDILVIDDYLITRRK